MVKADTPQPVARFKFLTRLIRIIRKNVTVSADPAVTARAGDADARFLEMPEWQAFTERWSVMRRHGTR